MDWDLIREEFETTEITLIDLAEKYNVKYPTIKSRKQRQSWEKKDASKDASNEQKDASKKKRGAPFGSQNAKGHGAPKGNKNALGNNGGPPKGNANAMTHGLFAKYLPAETLEIAQGMTEISPLDILWGNIMIQYAAIIRAQSLMEVESKDEIIKELKTDGLNSTTYEFQFAWDRQASFMTAQSKAMTTLNNMIKQYDELCRSELATEEQRARIAKLKSEIVGKNNPEDGAKNPYTDLTTEELKKLINDE